VSLTNGLIAIKGQHLGAIQDIVPAFRLVDNHKDQIVDNWDEIEHIINDLNRHSIGDYIETHVFWYSNGWTIMEDMSLAHCADEEALEALSQKFDTPVFSLFTQGTSNCFGFMYFDKKKLRQFFVNAGTVEENYGDPFTHEAKFSINEGAFYDDVHGVARGLGVDWIGAEKHDHFIVKDLDMEPSEIERIRPMVEKYQQEQAALALMKKPWWKFW